MSLFAAIYGDKINLQWRNGQIQDELITTINHFSTAGLESYKVR